MAPTLGNGKVCYLEIPAVDVEQSAEVFRKAFGWEIRRRGDGELAFDDTVGEVSGTWVLGRQPGEPGVLIYLLVDGLLETVDAVVALGGEIVQPAEFGEHGGMARFRDPAGNVFGLYHQPG
jgi:predicted enzyme related to lactoylglutathione lyase